MDQRVGLLMPVLVGSPPVLAPTGAHRGPARNRTGVLHWYLRCSPCAVHLVFRPDEWTNPFGQLPYVHPADAGLAGSDASPTPTLKPLVRNESCEEWQLFLQPMINEVSLHSSARFPVCRQHNRMPYRPFIQLDLAPHASWLPIKSSPSQRGQVSYWFKTN